MAPRTMTFGPLQVTYDDSVLEPRPWTLLQATWAAELATTAPPGPILELCAGAGQIGQAAAVLTGRDLVQVEVDRRTCGFAEANAAANVTRSSVDVRCGDLERAVRQDERFPIVLADPPYLPSDEVEEWEDDPERAIDGGEDGLDLLRRVAALAPGWLRPGGHVLVETSARQVAAARTAFARHGLPVRVLTDEDGGGAVLVARLPPDGPGEAVENAAAAPTHG